MPPTLSQRTLSEPCDHQAGAQGRQSECTSWKAARSGIRRCTLGWAVCCSVLLRAWGQRQAELPPQLAAAKGRLARPPQVLWTCEREEEGKGGYEKQERRETALDAWGEHGWPHQEAFWFW